MDKTPARLNKLAAKNTTFEKSTGKSAFSPQLRGRQACRCYGCARHSSAILSQDAILSQEWLTLASPAWRP